MKSEEYQLSVREKGMILLQSVAITVAIMFLFYRSFGAVIWFPVVLIFQQNLVKKREMVKRKAQLREEFLHGIGVLNTTLQAGFSMENAWKEVEKEVRCLYGEHSQFYLEIKEMNHQDNPENN